MTSSCVICAREAEHGYLDEVCFSRLAAMLRDIEDESSILEAVPSMQIRTGSGGGSLASERSPVVLDALVALDPRRGTGRIAYDDHDPWGVDKTLSVFDVLHSWARLAREEGDFDQPATFTVSGERDFLTRQLEWISAQPWIDEAFNEFRDLLGQLQRTNKTQPDKPVGICQLPRYESICGGRIWQREQERHIWRQAEPGGDRCVRIKVKVSDGPAFCERCRNTWDDADELNRLHLIEEQRIAELARPKTEDGRWMLTAQEIVSAGFVSSISNVRAMASRRGVRAVLGHYDPEWFAEKATA